LRGIARYLLDRLIDGIGEPLSAPWIPQKVSTAGGVQFA
jgi:hypothetical protein